MSLPSWNDLTLPFVVCYRLMHHYKKYWQWFAASYSMRCPKCGCQDDKVIDSRSSREGSTIRRRRECLKCEHRFTTYEEIEHKALVVVKRDGRREPFSKEKLLSGATRACEKRPVSADELRAVIDRIAEQIADEFDSEVPYLAIGERVMEGLRLLDEVAYVRYASVYRRFEEGTDFVQAVKKLEIKHDSATIRLPGF